METVGAYDAKTHFADLLQRVAAGEEITITRHGVPVAILAPVANRRRRDVGDVIAAIRASRQGCKLGGLSIRGLIEQGRR